MVIQMKNNVGSEPLDNLVKWLEGMGFEAHITRGSMQTIVGIIGDTSKIDVDMIMALDMVEDVKRIQEPFKNANRKFHPDDTVISIGDAKIGGGNFLTIAGPCSVETEDQICRIAMAVKASGADMLRGGAFKPRTSPYSFQGLRGEGIRLLLKAKECSGLPIITELMDLSHLDYFEDVDVIQIGARNMQNFELLKELGHLRKPILLKRGMSATLEELVMSAEYIMAGGNEQVILCERGIRTFEKYTRNTLDLSAIPSLKTLSHLPVVVDPSHGTGIARLVPSMSLAAVAGGADGLIIEVHNDPSKAWCDGPQSITPEAFDSLKKNIELIRGAMAEM